MKKYELTKKRIFEYADKLELAFFDGVTPELVAAFEDNHFHFCFV